ETGEFEIAMEDVVSVESMPGKQLPPPVKSTGPTATSLMAGVAPPPAPSKPQVNPPPVHARTTESPSNPPPLNAGHAQPAMPSAAELRRPAEDPLIFVPPVGALAPPPMTDTAAHAHAQRKKTRPWWEELFNDDFIRT